MSPNEHRELLAKLKKGRPADPKKAARLIMKLFNALSVEEQRKRKAAPKYHWFPEIKWLEPEDLRTYQLLFNSEQKHRRPCDLFWSALREGVSRHKVRAAHRRALNALEQDPEADFLALSRSALESTAEDPEGQSSEAVEPPLAASSASSVDPAPPPSDGSVSRPPTVDRRMAVLDARAAKLNLRGGAAELLDITVSAFAMITREADERFLETRAVATEAPMQAQPVPVAVPSPQPDPVPAETPLPLRPDAPKKRARKRRLKEDATRIELAIGDREVTIDEVVASLKDRHAKDPSEQWLPEHQNLNGFVSRVLRTFTPSRFTRLRRGTYRVRRSVHDISYPDAEAEPETTVH